MIRLGRKIQGSQSLGQLVDDSDLLFIALGFEDHNTDWGDQRRQREILEEEEPEKGERRRKRMTKMERSRLGRNARFWKCHHHARRSFVRRWRT
jgi:hypothetical protein